MPAALITEQNPFGMNCCPMGDGFIITLAPSRTGKGIGQNLPTLFTWEASLLVTDFKGENYALTACFRQNILKQKVFRFSPFEDYTDIWNPLLSIRST